jgi:hypothetical protein
MASAWYDSGLLEVLDGSTNLTTDVIKVLLADASYVPSKAHEFADDVSGDELSGTGYAGGFAGAGRKTLAGKAFANAANLISFTANAVTWSGIDAGTAAWAIIIREVSTDADSPILGYLDHADLVTDGGDIVLTPNAGGMLELDNT